MFLRNRDRPLLFPLDSAGPAPPPPLCGNGSAGRCAGPSRRGQSRRGRGGGQTEVRGGDVGATAPAARARGGDGSRRGLPRRPACLRRPACPDEAARKTHGTSWVCCAQRCFGRNPTQFPPRVPTVERKTTCFYFSLRLRHDLPQIGPGCWRHECPRPRNQRRPAWRGSEGRTSRRQGRPHRKRFLTKLLFLLSFLKNKIFKNSLAP